MIRCWTIRRTSICIRRDISAYGKSSRPSQRVLVVYKTEQEVVAGSDRSCGPSLYGTGDLLEFVRRPLHLYAVLTPVQPRRSVLKLTNLFPPSLLHLLGA